MEAQARRILISLGAAGLAAGAVYPLLGSIFNVEQLLKMKAHGTFAGLFVAVAGLAAALAWRLSRPVPTDEDEVDGDDGRAVAKEVLADAMRTVKADLDVPPELEQRFRTRYWIRLSRLFKL